MCISPKSLGDGWCTQQCHSRTTAMNNVLTQRFSIHFPHYLFPSISPQKPKMAKNSFLKTFILKLLFDLKWAVGKFTFVFHSLKIEAIFTVPFTHLFRDNIFNSFPIVFYFPIVLGWGRDVQQVQCSYLQLSSPFDYNHVQFYPLDGFAKYILDVTGQRLIAS